MSLADNALQAFAPPTVVAPIESQPEMQEHPVSIAAQEMWDAVKSDNAGAFKEALRNAISIAMNER